MMLAIQALYEPDERTIEYLLIALDCDDQAFEVVARMTWQEFEQVCLRPPVQT
jgi:hypothetical protein